MSSNHPAPKGQTTDHDETQMNQQNRQAAEAGATARTGAPGDKAIPVERLIAHIAAEMQVEQNQQIVRLETLDPIESRYASPSPPLPDLLRDALEAQGITQLYTHQVESLERVRNGENIVVVTATSSGKTLCYNLPIIERMLQDRSARALYIYPINALVNDQLKSLFRLNLELGSEAVSVARYTGSLNSGQRRMVRDRSPNLLLTNPEMLHLSFLLWHQNWEELWRNLRYIVVDEVHTYRGVFGSNMAQLFRRVLRMAQHYGSEPQCIFCSATIANPQELAETLTGLPFSVVDRDGAGRGRRYFALWNPPLLDSAASNLRRSYAEEAVDLMLHCIRANYNTIVFTRARQLTERMLRMSRTVTEQTEESGLADLISSYRAGYLAEEREDIENKLKGGDIRGIITTNALEMGIDIGGLDAAIISGYPGTIMSTWQQAGRAGRRGRDALIFLVASQNPLDQYYMHHPQEFFAQPHELAIIDQHNQHIRLKHLLCAARELPLTSAEIEQMTSQEQATVNELYRSELLVPCDLGDGREGLTYPKSRRDIHFRVSLRAASHETYQIIDEKRNEVGTIEPPNVFREAHPGAIYQHGGEDYRVTYLDRQQKQVRVREESAPHYTRSVSISSLHVDEVYAAQTFQLGDMPFVAALGDVMVEETIRGYQELQLGTDEIVKRVNLDYPLTMRLHTTAMWVALPVALAEGAAYEPPAPDADGDGQAEQASADEQGPAAGLHAMQHLLTGVMPLMVMCDRRDVDGFYHVAHPNLGDAPVVFLYDAYEGGIGLAEVAYQRVEELLRLAHETVARCGCATGCPSCIQSGACRLRNEQLDKGLARDILASMLQQGTVGDPALLARYRATVPTIQQPTAEASRYRPGQTRALQELLEYTRQKTIYDHLSAAGDQPQAPPEQRFAKGDWVEQMPYGRGLVLESRLEGKREMVRIRFIKRGLVREVDAAKVGLRKVQ
ncbi:MAG: DEAD/DEAH box helicase [Chloroflexi bacterium]|nr:DEAD/DEAH box helicase [Chloroflexota bacterium]